MKEKKLQVFVSSTFTDLREERQAAVEAILSSGDIPAGMELFAAGDESQMTVIKRWIDESDVYLLILGGRYGSIDKSSGKSYTHLEYEYAVQMKKPLFAVIISEKALNKKVKREGIEVFETESTKKYQEFRELVLNNLVKFWDDKKDIKIAIHETLAEFGYRKELVGWVKGDSAKNVEPFAEELARLTKENSGLRQKLDTQLDKSNITYTGLTFQELKVLLQQLNGVAEGKSLYDFLMENGEYFSTGMIITVEDARNVTEAGCRSKLIAFNLIELKEADFFPEMIFTNVGLTFYLKALSSKLIVAEM